jgi:hypothetical protein
MLSRKGVKSLCFDSFESFDQQPALEDHWSCCWLKCANYSVPDLETILKGNVIYGFKQRHAATFLVLSEYMMDFTSDNPSKMFFFNIGNLVCTSVFSNGFLTAVPCSVNLMLIKHIRTFLKCEGQNILYAMIFVEHFPYSLLSETPFYNQNLDVIWSSISSLKSLMNLYLYFNYLQVYPVDIWKSIFWLVVSILLSIFYTEPKDYLLPN